MSQDVGKVADRVAAATLSVPGVQGLHAGEYGAAATYLPGRRVTGVRMAEGVTEVHVTVSADAELLTVADEVRRAVAPLVSTGVDVFVEDIETQ